MSYKAGFTAWVATVTIRTMANQNPEADFGPF